MAFDLDLDLEHTLDAGPSGDHRVHVWWRSSHVCGRSSDLRVKVYRQTDRRTKYMYVCMYVCLSRLHKLIPMEWANETTVIKCMIPIAAIIGLLDFHATAEDDWNARWWRCYGSRLSFAAYMQMLQRFHEIANSGMLKSRTGGCVRRSLTVLNS